MNFKKKKLGKKSKIAISICNLAKAILTAFCNIGSAVIDLGKSIVE